MRNTLTSREPIFVSRWLTVYILVIRKTLKDFPKASTINALACLRSYKTLTFIICVFIERVSKNYSD